MVLNRILLYARDVWETVDFYERFFGFKALIDDTDRVVELVHPDGGACLMIHAAAKSQKTGQSTVKLVFDIEDVEAFCTGCADNGLVFGHLHRADGYVFANARDPSGNPISVSSRGFRKITE